jgi:general transcription factor 3C polypeptide 5 (transcription factor C subunit 1)
MFNSWQRFKERPVWTRPSLFSQFTPSEARDILKCGTILHQYLTQLDHYSLKPLLPLVCYVFQDGPWRDTLVRFQYDPRKEPEARL